MSGIIEFDVETTGLQWYAQHLFMVQFLGSGDPLVFKHPADSAEIQKYLNYKDFDYRAWNSKFDLHFLKSAGYELPDESQWRDGMVEAHLVDERRSVALQNRANALLGKEAAGAHLEAAVKDWIGQETKRRRQEAKDETKRLRAEWKEDESGPYPDPVDWERPNYSDVPDEIMVPYAAHDVVVQRHVGDHYTPLIEADPKLSEVYQIERETLGALFATERRGVPIDRAAAVAYEAEVMASLDTLTEEAKELAGIDTFNPNAPRQVEEALTRRGADLTFARETKTGRSMDEESLSAVDDLLAAKVLEYRNAYKIFSTYLRPMLHETDSKFGKRAPFLADDERIHPNFRQVGARTGRMSSADPNIQNWHRDNLDLRYLVRAEPDHVLISADLDAIEFRLYAAFIGPGALLDAIKEGRDIHSQNAKIAGIQDRQRIGGVETARQGGKVFGYTMIYGGGVRSLRRYFQWSSQKAKQAIENYRNAYPEAVALQRNIELKLIEQGFVRTRWGRKERADKEGYRAREEAYKFTNYIVQGTAADLLKVALNRVHAAGIPVVAPVHDELVAHVHKNDAEEAAHIIREALIDHPRITEHVPLEADAQIIQHWSQAKKLDYVPNYELKRREG